MSDLDAIVRCLAFVGTRLAKVSRRAERIPSKGLARQARALEMLVAACVVEAASTDGAERPLGTGEPRPLPATPPPVDTGPIVRGTWTPPS